MSEQDDGLEAVLVKVLLDEGGAPGSSIHSWRCEYPDRYGPCDCVEEAARELATAVRAYFRDLWLPTLHDEDPRL